MTNTKFSVDEKIAVTTLAIGSFLEYFDFFLFIHFASVLNKLFFAQGDAKTAAMLTSIAYCTTYIFRPFGAMFFGYIGDKYGRKKTINLTLVLMGVTCLGIFFLPTYDAIGVWASVLLTLFRVMQSFTTVGEIVGAHVYIIEYLKGKKAFTAVALIDVGTYLGGQLALHCVNFALLDYINWRYMFLFGLFIFLVGNFSRRNLKETVDFVTAKSIKKNESIPVNKKSFWYACALNTMQPVTWFIICVGLTQILRDTYYYNDSDVVKNNMVVFWCGFVDILVIVMLTKYIYPLTIVKVRNIITNFLLLISPLVIYYHTAAYQITIFQALLAVFGLGDSIIYPFVYKSMPILKRFKAGALIFVLPRVCVAVLTSFGLILAQPYLKNYTYLVFGLPFTLMAYFSIKYLEKLDRETLGYVKHYE